MGNQRFPRFLESPVAGVCIPFDPLKQVNGHPAEGPAFYQPQTSCAPVCLLQMPAVRILLFLHEKGDTRYAELNQLITSRGTLSSNLTELDEEGLVQRRVVPTKPIKSYYSLTEKGKQVAETFKQLNESL